MMKLTGLKMRVYWLVSYGFDIVLYLVSASLFAIVEIVTGARFFKETAWFILLLVFLTWGLAQVSLAYFLSSFINRTRTATGSFTSSC
jgi:hypothetical protein